MPPERFLHGDEWIRVPDLTGPLETDRLEISRADVEQALEIRPVPPRSGNGSDDPERQGAAVDFLRESGHTIDELEARLIREALARTDGHITQAAGVLGLSYKTMQYRIRKYGIRVRSAPTGGPDA